MKTRTNVLTVLAVGVLAAFYWDIKKAERQGKRNPYQALRGAIKSTFRQNPPVIAVKKVADSLICGAKKIRRDLRAKRAFQRIPSLQQRWGEVKYLCEAIDAGREMDSHRKESPAEFEEWRQKQKEETLSEIKAEEYQTQVPDYHQTIFGQLQLNGYAAEREWARAVGRDPDQTERFLRLWAEHSSALFEAVLKKIQQ
jgi:hypothetical protein